MKCEFMACRISISDYSCRHSDELRFQHKTHSLGGNSESKQLGGKYKLIGRHWERTTQQVVPVIGSNWVMTVSCYIFIFSMNSYSKISPTDTLTSQELSRSRAPLVLFLAVGRCFHFPCALLKYRMQDFRVIGQTLRAPHLWCEFNSPEWKALGLTNKLMNGFRAKVIRVTYVWVN